MREKFIEGTNNQYSIREDGVVFSLSEYNGRIKGTPMRIIKNRKSKTIAYKLMYKEYSLSKLMIENFGWKKCATLECDNKIFKIREINCPDCVKKMRRVNRLKSDIKHSEKRKKYNKSVLEKNSKLLTREYIAGILKVSKKDLSEDLYKIQKELLAFKRRVAEENKIHINKLK